MVITYSLGAAPHRGPKAEFSQAFAMPIYEYQCDKCGVFEVTQRITENALKKCPTCKGKVERIISSTSFVLKGSGWYVTDYARSGNAKSGGGESGDSAKPSDASSSSGDNSSKSSDSSKESSSKTAGSAKPAETAKPAAEKSAT